MGIQILSFELILLCLMDGFAKLTSLENDTVTLNVTNIQEGRIQNVRRRGCPCQNGGSCILGAFCTCPIAFQGRYCENAVGNKPCGALPHMAEQLDFTGNCQLCRCIDGTLLCDNQYTCGDLSDYAEAHSQLRVSKGSRNITLYIQNSHVNQPSAPMPNWLLILPHSSDSSNGTNTNKLCNWLCIFFLLQKFTLYFT